MQDMSFEPLVVSFFSFIFFLTNIACLSSDLQTMHCFGKRGAGDPNNGPKLFEPLVVSFFFILFFLTN